MYTLLSIHYTVNIYQHEDLGSEIDVKVAYVVTASLESDKTESKSSNPSSGVDIISILIMNVNKVYNCDCYENYGIMLNVDDIYVQRISVN